MSHQKKYLFLILLTLCLSIDSVDSGLIGWAIPDEEKSSSWTILLKPRQRRGFMERRPNAMVSGEKNPSVRIYIVRSSRTDPFSKTFDSYRRLKNFSSLVLAYQFLLRNWLAAMKKIQKLECTL